MSGAVRLSDATGDSTQWQLASIRLPLARQASVTLERSWWSGFVRRRLDQRADAAASPWTGQRDPASSMGTHRLPAARGAVRFRPSAEPELGFLHARAVGKPELSAIHAVVRRWARAAVGRGQLDASDWPSNRGAVRDGVSRHLRSAEVPGACDAAVVAHASARRSVWTPLGISDDASIRERAIEGHGHDSQDLADRVAVPRRRSSAGARSIKRVTLSRAPLSAWGPTARSPMRRVTTGSRVCRMVGSSWRSTGTSCRWPMHGTRSRAP